MNMNLFLEFLGDWGLSGLLIALIAFILTAIVKMPIKKLAKDRLGEDKSKVTKYFVLLPIMFCFFGSIVDCWLRGGISAFSSEFDWMRVIKETFSTMGIPSLIMAFVENFGGDWENSFRKELESSRANAEVEEDTQD